MFALVNINTGKVCAVKETKNELMRAAVSIETIHDILKGGHTLHEMSIGEAWDKVVSKDYRIESVGFDNE